LKALVLLLLLVLPSPLIISAQQQEPIGTVDCNNMNVTGLSVVSGSLGRIDVLGVLMNNSTLTYEDVRVVGEFYDSNNKLIGVENAEAEFDTLDLRDRSPFKIETDVSNQTLDHYIITCGSSGGEPQIDQSTQTTGGNISSQLYSQCLETTGKGIVTSCFKDSIFT
jgi:hypothetical protein